MFGVVLCPREDEEAEATLATRTDSEMANNTITKEMLAGAIIGARS
jgi:hypothetical protein